jgi:hypothetical protein
MTTAKTAITKTTITTTTTTLIARRNYVFTL